MVDEVDELSLLDPVLHHCLQDGVGSIIMELLPRQAGLGPSLNEGFSAGHLAEALAPFRKLHGRTLLDLYSI